MLHFAIFKAHRISIAVVLMAACLVNSTRALSAQDAINGIPIIEKLDLDALPRGHIYRFWFKAVDNSIGQAWHVPVIVNRGAKDGPRLLLNSGTHGDELNGIRVVQRVALSVDPAKLSGTIIGIPGLNTTGLLAANRNFILSRDGGYTSDLNRLMPGTENEGDVAARFVGRVWNKVWKGNADYVIDLHTQSRGTAYPVFVWVDPRNEKARMIAETLAPDIIKYDPGEKGTAETEFIKQNIPAVTFELGRPNIWQADLINRGVDGLHRVLMKLQMVSEPPVPPAPIAQVTPFLGNESTTLRAKTGGFVELYVGLLDEVQEGQLLARQMNAFGDVVADYKAPHAGKVLSIGDEPVREPGSTIVRLIRWNPSESCKLGC